MVGSNVVGSGSGSRSTKHFGTARTTPARIPRRGPFQNGSESPLAKPYAPVRLIVGMLIALVGAPLEAGEPSMSTKDRWRSYVPAGWEAGDCPPAYGADAVFCAATNTGSFKVDRHIPTLSIRAAAGSCAQAEKDVVSRLSKYGMTVSRKSNGRCGPEAAPCTELRLKDPRPTDPLAPTVSAKVIDAFEPLARAQAHWRPGN
jgi:hypothetical protein